MDSPASVSSSVMSAPSSERPIADLLGANAKLYCAKRHSQFAEYLDEIELTLSDELSSALVDLYGESWPHPLATRFLGVDDPT